MHAPHQPRWRDIRGRFRLPRHRARRCQHRILGGRRPPRRRDRLGDAARPARGRGGEAGPHRRGRQGGSLPHPSWPSRSSTSPAAPRARPTRGSPASDSARAMVSRPNASTGPRAPGAGRGAVAQLRRAPRQQARGERVGVDSLEAHRRQLACPASRGRRPPPATSCARGRRRRVRRSRCAAARSLARSISAPAPGQPLELRLGAAQHTDGLGERPEPAEVGADRAQLREAAGQAQMLRGAERQARRRWRPPTSKLAVRAPPRSVRRPPSRHAKLGARVAPASDASVPPLGRPRVTK